ncbi:MAG: DNA alkylation repair protein [Owenweeksia sp.]|nr:DNA alkylation repair protein [Owenweeksia sp.]
MGYLQSSALGLRMPILRKLAKDIGHDQALAGALWQRELHEAKLLATLITEPSKFTPELADSWLEDVYSWDICDQLCINTLVKLEERWDLPQRLTPNPEEYVRRAGLVMIVALRIHDKKANDASFLPFITLLRKYATDERNFVKKAVNWAIRELGKRSASHHPLMIDLCQELWQTNSKSAHWIARDALKELQSDKVKARLGLIQS